MCLEVFLTVLREKNPEGVNGDSGADRSMEQKQNRHDDGQGSSPVATLNQSASGSSRAGSDGSEKQSDHAGDPADEMRHAGRHIRRHWKRPMPEDLTDKQNEKRTNACEYTAADQQPAED